MRHARIQCIQYAALLLMALHDGYAATESYSCIPTHAYELNVSGNLVLSETFQKLSKPFVVERNTGRIVGGLLDNEGMTIHLLDVGSKRQSFKVTSRTTSIVVHVSYLQINEFEASARKPFIGFRSPNSVTVSGTCE